MILLHQLRQLPQLIRLRSTSVGLEIQVIRDVRVFVHQVAPTLPPEHKAEILHEPPRIREGHVLKVPVRQSQQ